MKCESCLKLLEEYLDGELIEQEAAALSAHLITCAACAHEVDHLTVEREIYTRYDRELDNMPATWSAIAARTTETDKVIASSRRLNFREWFVVPSFGWSLAAVMAILIFAVVMGAIYLRPTKPAHQMVLAGADKPVAIPERLTAPENRPQPNNTNPRELVADKTPVRLPARAKSTVSFRVPQAKKRGVVDSSDVLFSETAYSPAEERDTQRHIEQAQNLLRSVRNIQVADDGEIDVSFEKNLARRLLNENVVLRRDAEMSGKFPTKILLGDLEPFLIDIANLPNKPAPDDLRVLKERVLKTEIVAALQSY
ncbi:MAG: zf-HC2 domain-containing protein [Acidobacteriota bacterium]|nr:zf-HC2 domain-containing protein [Acidobacteriota bacterium]